MRLLSALQISNRMPFLFRIYFTACLASICYLAGLNAASVPERVDFYYGIAEGNYLIGDLTGAEKSVAQILLINPDYVRAITLNARVQLDLGKGDLALVAAERAIELEPNNLKHHLLKALILGNLQRRPQAIQIIQSVIQQAPPKSDDHQAATHLLGLLQMAEGDWDAAASSFDQIYQADPESASAGLKLSSEAYLEKADLALQQQKNKEAVAAIDQAIAVYDGKTGQEALQQRTSLRMIRARVLTQLGDFDPAIQDLQALSAQQPENLELAITLASLYASTDRWRSLDALIPVISGQPELQDIALYFEGRSALAKGRVGSARAKFEAALELDNQSRLTASLHFYRGLCLDQLERPQDAQVEILQALDLDFKPETSTEAILASRILIRTNQAQRAIPILEALCLNQIDPSAEVWTLLARAQQAVDSNALAISALNEALTIDPQHAIARALRAALLRKIGDLEGAAADYEVAIQVTPENAAYRYALGLVYFQLGQLATAESQIARAAQLLPQNASIQLLHALLAYVIQAPTAAQSALENYLTLSPQQPNESVFYLEYALNAQSHPEQAILKLQQRAAQPTSSEFLQKFIQYNTGQLERKEIIDHAGIAETPQIARQQICEVTFWIAQHEKALGNSEVANQLLQLILQVGNPDIPEFQFAKWQLK